MSSTSVCMICAYIESDTVVAVYYFMLNSSVCARVCVFMLML